MRDLHEVEIRFEQLAVPTYAGLRVFKRKGTQLEAEEVMIRKQERKKKWNSSLTTEQRMDKAAKQRAKRFQKNVAMWMQEAKMICVGRDLHPELWVAYLKNPITEEQREAQIDFVYFLHKCKLIPFTNIASMLDMSVATVKQLLASRK